MHDPSQLLEPLADAEPAIVKLSEYETVDELAGSVQTVGRAVDRSLRRLLRADPGTPDALRLAAFSPEDLPSDRLVEALRKRDLISLELAGLVHQLRLAYERATAGEPRAADADAALAAVTRLRAEIQRADETRVRESAHHVVTARALDESPQPVPPIGSRRAWPWVVASIAVALLVVVGVVSVITLTRTNQLEAGIAAFRAGQMDVAEEEFREVVDRDPENVTALIYLARIYRRAGRYEEAAGVLHAAARAEPNDAGVRRELGHLLLELGRPEAAADEYQRALELEPDRAVTWIGMIQALRAADDPRAEEYLQRAPPAARAALEQRD